MSFSTVPAPTPLVAPSETASAGSSGSGSREREPAASPRSPAVKREAPELLVPKREAAEAERDSPTMETRHAGYGAPPDQRSPYERPPDDHVRSYRYTPTFTNTETFCTSKSQKLFIVCFI